MSSPDIPNMTRFLLDSELFVSDHGCNLLSLDIRNGRTAYSYKSWFPNPSPVFQSLILTDTRTCSIEIAGQVNCIVPYPDESDGNFLASTSQDRLLRIHSTWPPPEKEGAQQEKKGEVLASHFMKAIPTVAVYDPSHVSVPVWELGKEAAVDEEEEELLWANMQDAHEADKEGTRAKKRRKPVQMTT